jgi:diguanylate cyclase
LAAQRFRRVSRSFVGSSADVRISTAVGTLVALFALSYGFAWIAGGADRLAPHWFYLPVLFAAVRFGLVGAAVAAPLAMLLAGPLLPADVGEQSAQHLADWLSRGAGFALVGLFTAVVIDQETTTIQHQRRATRLEHEVRRALAKGEFVLHYQPIVDQGTGRVVAAEALIRWQHPTRGLLHPDDFLDEIEHISSLAGWVLSEASRQAAAWETELPVGLEYVAVNISGDDLADFDFVHQVVNVIRAAGIDPRRLCVEVTERTLIEDLELASARLSVLRSVGVRIAVDDFGTGHASLHYLQELPVDIVKIDRTFVASPRTRRRNHAIVSAIVELARQLGAATVAEGVERVDELAALREAGFDGRVQGYLFGRPISPAAFAARCAEPAATGRDRDRNR